MKIEDKRSESRLFKDVYEGEAFMYSGNLYVKTEDLTDDVQRVCNSVLIRSGVGEIFRDNMIVEMVDAKVVIE